MNALFFGTMLGWGASLAYGYRKAKLRPVALATPIFVAAYAAGTAAIMTRYTSELEQKELAVFGARLQYVRD